MIYKQAISIKPFRHLSEDIIDNESNYYWLMDGATPPQNKRDLELTQKFIHSFNLNLKMIIKKNKFKSLNRIVQETIKKTKESFIDFNKYTFFPSATIILIKVSANTIDYFILGDSYLVIQTDKEKIILSDDRLKNIAKEERRIVQNLIEKNINENSPKYIKARKILIEKEYAMRNTDNGFWILDLDEKSAHNALTGKYSFINHFNIFVASDGYTRLVTHFNEVKDLFELADKSFNNGFTLLQRLRYLETNKLFTRPISSQYDDASYFILKNS